ncbi:MAG: preprotein translocase subunit SecG [Rickettsiaceae bacterium]|jgi:preprotein translocase subunit SecG|nr:preprotein translocase subunit SecG [Rickettsiaceae bacterium]
MLNTLLFIHLIIALLLVVVILLQKTSTDGLSGIGGGGNNMGLMSGRSAANFLTRTTIVLGVIFFANALMLANLSSKSHKSISSKIEKSEPSPVENSTDSSSLPIAK